MCKSSTAKWKDIHSLKSTTKISRDEKLASCEEYICTWKEEKDCCFDMQRKRTRCTCLKEQLTQEPMGKKCYAMLFGVVFCILWPFGWNSNSFLANEMEPYGNEPRDRGMKVIYWVKLSMLQNQQRKRLQMDVHVPTVHMFAKIKHGFAEYCLLQATNPYLKSHHMTSTINWKSRQDLHLYIPLLLWYKMFHALQWRNK